MSSTDFRSVSCSALERKIVRALRRLDVAGQVEVLATINAIADANDEDARFVAELSAEARAA